MRDARTGAGGIGKAKRGKTTSLLFPFLLPIIPCFISLPQLTHAPFRNRETTGDESALARSRTENTRRQNTQSCHKMDSIYLAEDSYERAGRTGSYMWRSAGQSTGQVAFFVAALCPLHFGPPWQTCLTPFDQLYVLLFLPMKLRCDLVF